MFNARALWLSLSFFAPIVGMAAPEDGRTVPAPAAAGAATAASPTSEDLDVSNAPFVVSRHTGTFHGRSIAYTATAGRIPIRGPDGSIDAQMFYVAYTLDRAPPGSRPLTFLSNGGPGAATAWMHLGGIGPRKLVLNADGSTPPGAVRVAANPDSILDRTDLVFIDAAGTGYSRASSDAAKARLFQKAGDLQSYANFIRQYLTGNNRWASPIFLFGESYGGMRMAGLSDVLIRQGVPLQGIILLSAVIDDQALEPGALNDLPYQLLMPSYATIAGFHARIDPALAHDGVALRRAAEEWATNEYGPALAKGNRLGPEERARVVGGLARFTGLPHEIIDASDLRINVFTFMKYLMNQPGMVAGRVDGRLVGPAPSGSVEEPFYDPAMGSLTPAFNSATNQYLADELHYVSSSPYRMYSREVATRFALGPEATYGAEGYPEALSALQSTVVKNADLKLLTMNGIYDLACPYWSMEYSLDHMALPPSYRANITSVRLDAGHMAYADAHGLSEIGDNVVSFIDRSMPRQSK